ncbi:hypothetical protein CACET_c22360 [Clostridium aceticum]|uniref:Phage protein n=1 Tax=Clostridium aceticum TaxID=84022 RepID=A0A0G3WCP1_9CLOT|nr:hypothetical protein [Clostridium aceticum]AKL95682.1 hypothetical protein CACET_c22360 [Clostridium aceticum]
MIIGWVIAGAIAAFVLTSFWDDIKNWLNNVAADAVEKRLGYNARNRMHRAVSKIDRVMDRVRNRTVIMSKRNELDNMYDKVTLSAEASVHEIDPKVLDKINAERELIQEFQYRG